MRSNLNLTLTKQECLIIYGMRALKILPATRDFVQTKLGVSKSIANDALKQLKLENKIYISGWSKDGAAESPMYSAGDQEDEVRPCAKVRKKRTIIKAKKSQVLPFKLPDRCYPKVKSDTLTQWRTAPPWLENSLQT